MKKKLLKTKKEKGIALLFALAMLSMFFLVSLAFTTTSRTEKKSSSTMLAASSAKNFAYSVLDSALGSLDQALFSLNNGNAYRMPANSAAGLFLNSSATNGWFAVTPTPSVAPFNLRYMGSATTTGDQTGIETALALEFGPNLTRLATKNNNGLGWQHVKESSTDVDSPLIYRYAWAIIDMSGRIDPGAVVATGTNPTVPVINEGTETHNGFNMDEINLEGLFTVGGTFSDQFQAQNNSTEAGILKDWERWHSFKDFFNRYKLMTGTPPTLETDSVIQYMNPVTSPEKMAAIDVSTRYDLSGAGTDTVANIRTGISWLNTWTDIGENATFANTLNRVNQVAANIKDYSDTDLDASTDNPINPTYVGVEKVPFINEIVVQLSNTATTGSPGVAGVLEATVIVETIQMWGSASAATTLDLELLISGGPHAGTYTFPIPINVHGANGYEQSTPVTITLSGVAPADNPTSITSIRVVSAKLNSPTGGIWDFARTAVSGNASIPTSSTLQTSIEANDPRQNTNTKDWGIALISSPTVKSLEQWKQPWAPGGDTLGQINDIVVIDLAATNRLEDREPSGIQPWQVSTAYIRNAPMQSLSELGLIHRGEEWQTLNLTDKNYNSTAIADGKHDYSDLADTIRDPLTADVTAVLTDQGDGGDRNIIDHVRLADKATNGGYGEEVSSTLPEKDIRGQININSAHRAVLRTLFEGIKPGTANAAPGSGSGITYAKLWDLTSQFPGTPVPSGSPVPLVPQVYFRYSDIFTPILPIPTLPVLPTNSRNPDRYGIPFSYALTLTDRDREELLMKTKDFVSTKYNYFMVVVTAQYVKDTKIVKLTDSIEYDNVAKKYCTILASEKIIAYVRRDVSTSKYKILRIQRINY